MPGSQHSLGETANANRVSNVADDRSSRWLTSFHQSHFQQSPEGSACRGLDARSPPDIPAKVGLRRLSGMSCWSRLNDANSLYRWTILSSMPLQLDKHTGGRYLDRSQALFSRSPQCDLAPNFGRPVAEPETNVPESVTVTCPTCHERIGVRLTAEPQSVRCTYCKAPVSVPSREQARTQQTVKSNYPAPTVEEYAIAPPDDIIPGDAARAKAASVKPGRAKSRRETGQVGPAPVSVTLECPTCHELVKATVGSQPSRAPCTFCGAPLSVPDRRTLAGWRAKKVEPPAAIEIGEYAAVPVPQAQTMRRGSVFEWLAEIRQEVVPPPRWTFFSGVFTLPWRSDAVVRWAYLTVGFTAILMIGVVLKGLASSFSGMSTGIAAAFFLLPIIWISFMTFSYAAACCLCVLESTAGGLDRIEGWPDPNWKEWMAQLMYVAWIGAIPLGISYGLAVLGDSQGISIVWTMPIAFFVLYPISLMSALESNSIWVPLTMSILGSLARWWWCWLLFYLVTGPMALGIVAVANFSLNSSNNIVFIGLGPLLPAALLIYFRLFGRLGWRITTNSTAHRREISR